MLTNADLKEIESRINEALERSRGEGLSVAVIDLINLQDEVNRLRFDHNRHRELLRDAVILFESKDECSDPSTDAWGWLQAVRTELEGVRA